MVIHTEGEKALCDFIYIKNKTKLEEINSTAANFCVVKQMLRPQFRAVSGRRRINRMLGRLGVVHLLRWLEKQAGKAGWGWGS